MKRHIFGFILVAAFIFGAVPVNAQPAPMPAPAMTPAPAAMPAPMPAVVPTMTPSPVPAPMPAAMTPAPAPMPAAMGSEAPATAKPTPAAMAPVPVPDKPKTATPAPKWKTASFWISEVALPVLLFVLGLGWFKQSWAKWMKEKGILVIADKVANGFEAYAEKTPALWDDALAQALKAVVARFGELSPEQEAKVKAVIEERKQQSEKKNGNGEEK